MAISVRAGAPADLDAILAIQDASAELSPWQPDSLARILSGDSGYGLLVASTDDRVAAFLLWRELPADETEILSLAVEPLSRRQGFARILLQELFDKRSGDCFLEVRSSNIAAQALYREFAFEKTGVRRAYYHRPVEDALIMRKAEMRPKKGT